MLSAAIGNIDVLENTGKDSEKELGPEIPGKATYISLGA
jgi:hypothetical protein